MWLPSLDEVLEGLHRTLERSVIPAIEDEYARRQAMSVSLRLIGLAERWSSFAGWLELENAEMRDGLTSCAEALEAAAGSSDGEPARIAMKIRAQVSRIYPPEPARRNTASFAEENTDLGVLMEQAILGLETLQRDAPAETRFAAAREALRVVLRAQAERRDPGLDSSEIQHPN